MFYHRFLDNREFIYYDVCYTVMGGGAVTRFVCACAALLECGGGARAEALGCLQQLQMFTPRHINLHSLVPQLCVSLFTTLITL